MANYETLLQDLEAPLKSVKDNAAAAGNKQKALVKNLNAGNLTEAKKNLSELEEALRALNSQAEAIQAQIESFDVQAYFTSGDFARQLLDACAEKKIDVRGEKGVYEMFPNKVRILGDDDHTAEVWLDRKKIQSCRPQAVAETIRAGQEKLYRTAFKAEAFMGELVDAYEIACLRDEKIRKGASISLEKVYRQLAPMARTRRDYDRQAFAFDLARLYERGRDSWITKDGRRFDFGTSRNGTGYRVLSRTGVESYVNTMNLVRTIED